MPLAVPPALRPAGLVAAVAATLVLLGSVVSAHPTPYSYVDIRMHRAGIDVTVAAHIIDVAHDLGLDRPEDLLDVAPTPQTAELLATLLNRARLRVDDHDLTCGAVSYERLAPSQSVRWTLTCDGDSSGGNLTVSGPLFPYDPEHQMFVTLYVDDGLVGQATLDQSTREAAFPVQYRQSRWAAFTQFLISGIEHIVGGPDHLLFLAGLLLTGGTLGRLAAIVTAFTVAHSVTLVLAALDVLSPPPGLIEPVIALSIVYVGVNNLSRTGVKEWRILTAGIFGLIHGFGFAYVLREMQLPRRDLAWSLFSFNLGVEVGQLAVVVLATALFTAARRSRLITERGLVVAGSIVVAAVGAYWFVDRLMA